MTEKTMTEQSLADLIERGGVYYNAPGESPKELIAGVIDLLPPLLAAEPRRLLGEILDREALMSTGIGRGIAVPHPRNPIVSEPQSGGPFVALAFPASKIDWNTPDGSKVHTVFLIASVSAKQHLGTLSKINFLCQQEKFLSLITARAPKEDIIAAIREAESSWVTR